MGTRSVPIGDRDWDRPPSGRAAADLGGDGEGGDGEATVLGGYGEAGDGEGGGPLR